MKENEEREINLDDAKNHIDNINVNGVNDVENEIDLEGENVRENQEEQIINNNNDVNNAPENINEVDNNINNNQENINEIDNNVNDAPQDINAVDNNQVNNNQVDNNAQPGNNAQKQVKMAEYNLEQKLEDGEQQFDEAEINRKVELAKQAYKAQASKEDKILFFYAYNAHNDIYVANPLPNMTIEYPENLSEVEVEAIKEQADNQLKEAEERRIAAGMRRLPGTAEAEDACMEKLKEELIMDLIGDGSYEYIKDSIATLGVIQAWNKYNQGKVYEEQLKLIPEGAPNRDRKARFLAYKKSMLPSLYSGILLNFNRDFMGALNLSDDIGYKVKKKIWDNLQFDKNTTRFSYYLTKMGLTPDERQLYLDTNGFKETDNVYNAFKQRLLDSKAEDQNFDIEAYQNSDQFEDDILNAIYDDYTKEFSEKVQYQGMKIPVEYFDLKYNEHMTINHFMNMLLLDETRKQDFMNFYHAKADDKLYDVMKAALNSNEEFKSTLNDPNNISDADIKKYALNVMHEEFANKRARIKEFDDNYSHDMTVEQFFKIVDYTEFEQSEFIIEHDIALSDKASVAFAKILKDDAQYRLDNNVSENPSQDEIDAYIKYFLTNEITKQIENSKYLKGESTLAKQAVSFGDNMPIFANKLTYLNGQIIDGGEGLVPKVNPKSELDKEFKEWRDTVGNRMLEESHVDDMVNAMKSVTGIIYTKKAINLRNDEAISWFYDGKVTVSDTTFLKGVITELEATKTGKHYFRSKTERSNNSTEYDNMLRALKTYYNKLTTDDKDGLLEAKNALRDYCKDYIKDKYSVRSRTFGKVRFDAAMTLLYDLMPKSEFSRLLLDINNTRGVRTANHPDAVSFDKYNLQYTMFYSAEEARQEERQVAAEGDKLRTDIPQFYQEQFMNVMNVFRPDPIVNDELNKVFGNEFNNKFPKIEANFVAIGKGLKDRNLSVGDFAALGYAGTLTYNVGLIDKRFNETWQINKQTKQEEKKADSELQINKALITGKDYTVALAKMPISKETALYADVIQGGRNAAANAMAEYAKGNKFPLINVIRSGIRNIAAMCRLSKEINEDFICNAEMGKRLVEMLNRDESLILKETFDNYKEMSADIKYISSIYQVSKIYINEVKAMKELSDAEFNGVNLTEEKKLDLVTDILMRKVVSDSKDSFNKSMENALKKRTDLKKIIHEADVINSIETGKAIEMEITNDDDKIKRERLIDEAAAHRELRVLIAKDYLRDDKLIKSLTSYASVEALRKSVKDLAKESGFARLSPGEIIQKMNNPKVIQKLAAVTQNANEKAGEELAKERQAEVTENVKAQQAEHKRAQKLARHH